MCENRVSLSNGVLGKTLPEALWTSISRVTRLMTSSTCAFWGVFSPTGALYIYQPSTTWFPSNATSKLRNRQIYVYQALLWTGFRFPDSIYNRCTHGKVNQKGKTKTKASHWQSKRHNNGKKGTAKGNEQGKIRQKHVLKGKLNWSKQSKSTYELSFTRTIQQKNNKTTHIVAFCLPLMRFFGGWP